MTKAIIMCLALASVIQLHGALSNSIYLKSAIADKNDTLAESIIAILPTAQKDGATKLFRDAFGRDPKAAGSGLSLEDRKKLIDQASADLQKKLQGKDLSKEDDLKEILQYIGGPDGSGGKLAKQLGQAKTAELTTALTNSAR